MNPRPPLRVALVGLGRLGQALARGLSHAGVRPAMLFARSPERHRALSAELSIPITDDLSVLVASADLIWCGVSDAALPEVAAALQAALPATIPAPMLVHSSGALPGAILRGGPIVSTASVHPLASLPLEPEAWRRFEGASFALEGDEQALLAVEPLVLALGGKPQRLASAAKPLYHAAACLAANTPVACLDLAERLLAMAGLDPLVWRAGLTQLALGAVDNSARIGPAAALTGPIVRGDAATISLHCAALEGHEELREYLAAANVILAAAERSKRLSPGQRNELASVLAAVAYSQKNAPITDDPVTGS